MKNLVLTALAENELKNLLKIQLQIEDSDIDLYYDFSSYDQLLFDMQMFVDGDYIDNEFEDLDVFANDISESEGSEKENVLERINKAIQLNLIEIKNK
jgi:hypothetical protein